jgi:hypothetical protein
VGWPLLTVETEANGDTRSTYDRGPSLVFGLVLPVQEIFALLAALVGPCSTEFFFLLPYVI